MNDVKAWYQSSSILGSAIGIAALAVGVLFGVQVDAATQQLVLDQLVTLISVATILGGQVLSIYGRIKARKVIG